MNGVYYYGAERLCDGNTLAHCVINGNGGPGVFINSGSVGRCDGNTLADCTIIGNASYGIYFSSSSGQCEGNLISGCTISKNAIRGIWLSSANGNRVEGNHVSGQIGAFTHGIECSSTARNLILRNTCVGQTNNFTMSANDTYGPIVTGSGALSTTNGAAGLSPWANFSR